MNYSDYPFIMDVFASDYSLYGYVVHLLFILLQSGLCVFIISYGLFGYFNIRPGLKIFPYLGLTDPLPEKNSSFFSVCLIGIGISLLFPLVVGVPYLISGISCMLAFITLVYLEKSLREKKTKGRYARYLMAFFSVICAGFIFYEKSDALDLGLDIMLKALKYRNHEVAWQIESDKTSPKVGDMAPDFELFDTSGQHSIRLSEFRDKKPVVLIFGAHT